MFFRFPGLVVNKSNHKNAKKRCTILKSRCFAKSNKPSIRRRRFELRIFVKPNMSVRKSEFLHCDADHRIVSDYLVVRDPVTGLRVAYHLKNSAVRFGRNVFAENVTGGRGTRQFA